MGGAPSHGDAGGTAREAGEGGGYGMRLIAAENASTLKAFMAVVRTLPSEPSARANVSAASSLKPSAMAT